MVTVAVVKNYPFKSAFDKVKFPGKCCPNRTYNLRNGREWFAVNIWVDVSMECNSLEYLW